MFRGGRWVVGPWVGIGLLLRWGDGGIGDGVGDKSRSDECCYWLPPVRVNLESETMIRMIGTLFFLAVD